MVFNGKLDKYHYMYEDMIGPGGVNPIPKKVLPFPLENIEETLADVYFEMDKIRKRIEVVKRNNVTSLTEMRLKQLGKMQYKINTAMNLVRDLTKDLDSFWIN
jgi:hypothetical protein